MMDYVNIFSADNSGIHDYDDVAGQRIGKINCATVK